MTSILVSPETGLKVSTVSHHGTIHPICVRRVHRGATMRIIPSCAAIAASLSTSLISFPAHSQTEDDLIVVTATRTPVSVEKSLVSTVLISREDIEKSQAPYVTDLLRSIAGVEISSNGGPGQTTSIFIRGAESDHTLILVDGVKLNPGTIGVAAIQNMPVDMIDRIEISMGPRSTLYGSDAIGGVIQIITRKGELAEAGWRFGSYDTHQLSGSLHGKTDSVRYGIDLSGTQSDGFPARAEGTEDSPYSNESINLKLGSRFGNTDVDAGYWYSSGTTDYYNFLLTPVDQDYRNSIASLTAVTQANSSWVSNLRYSFFEDKIEQNQTDDFLTTERHEIDWQNDVALNEQNLLTAGLQVYQENAQSLSFGSSFDEDIDSFELYAQDQFETGRHQLQGGLHYTNHSSFSGHTTGELNYGIQASDSIRLVGNLASGFRAPSSTDRFGFGGNPDLDPETSVYAELTGRFTPSLVHRGHLTLFQNEIDDLISFVDPDGFSGPIPGRNENIDETRTRGIDLGYAFRKNGYELDAGIVYQDPKDLTTGKQLPRRAKQKYTLTGRYVGSDYSLSAEAIYTGERPDSAYSDIVLDSYTLLNLSGKKNIAKRINLGIRFENITDEEYQLADGFNTAGRSVYFDIRYQNHR